MMAIGTTGGGGGATAAGAASGAFPSSSSGTSSTDYLEQAAARLTSRWKFLGPKLDIAGNHTSGDGLLSQQRGVGGGSSSSSSMSAAIAVAMAAAAAAGGGSNTSHLGFDLGDGGMAGPPQLSPVDSENGAALQPDGSRVKRVRPPSAKKPKRSMDPVTSGGIDTNIRRCEECDKNYTTREGLRLHIRNVHLEDKKHICDICDMRFVRGGDLKLHTIRVHEPTDARPCRCTYPNCDKAFACRSELTRHGKIHAKKAARAKRKAGAGWRRVDEDDGAMAMAAAVAAAAAAAAATSSSSSSVTDDDTMGLDSMGGGSASASSSVIHEPMPELSAMVMNI
jgi:hypothetical protein